MLKRLSFGWCVSVVTGVVFGFMLMFSMLHWDEVRTEASASLRSQTLYLEQLQAEQGESWQAQIDSNRWLLKNFDHLAFGSMFSTILMLSIAAVSLVAWSARKKGLALQGRFSTMRPPDWLVWVAIATALAALAEYHWPNDVVRLISWNTGTGLFTIYWLNGVACVIYLVTTLQLNLLMVVVFVLTTLVIMPEVGPLFSVLGFFDTWLELRQKVDKLDELRRNAANDQGDS